MGLSIVVDDESGRYGLDYAFVVFLYALDELPYGREELLVEVGIEELVPLDHLSLCGFKLFRGGHFLEGIVAIGIDGHFVAGADGDVLAGLALNDMVLFDALDKVGLIELAGGDPFLDHPPLIIEVLLCKFALSDVLQKL